MKKCHTILAAAIFILISNNIAAKMAECHESEYYSRFVSSYNVPFKHEEKSSFTEIYYKKESTYKIIVETIKGKAKENGYICISDIETGKPFIEGRYISADGQSYIDGVSYEFAGNQVFQAVAGYYLIQNTPSGALSFKSKEGDKISVSSESIYRYYKKEEFGDLWIYKIGENQNEFKVIYSSISTCYGIRQFCKVIPDSLVYVRASYEEILNYESPINIEYYNGDTYTGNCGVSIYDNDMVFPTVREGTLTHVNGDLKKEVFLKSDDMINYLGEFSAQNRTYKSISVNIPLHAFKYMNVWSCDPAMFSSYPVNITYRNNDKFEGTAECSILSDLTYSFNLGEGHFYYSNGDEFIGNLSGVMSHGLPINGYYLFKDGTKAEGDWLKSYLKADYKWLTYDFSEEEWKAIDGAEYPSEKKELAIKAKNKAHYEDLTLGGEMCFEHRQYKDALEYLNKSIKYANNDKEKRYAQSLIADIKKAQEIDLKIAKLQQKGFVDLGLSVMWASKNLGADTPENPGGYYAWGELKEKEKCNWFTYSHARGSHETMTDIGRNISGTKYDAVTSLYGDIARMPTYDDYKELIAKCTFSYVKKNGTYGMIVTGPNGNSIFIPHYIESSDLFSDFKVHSFGKYYGYWTASSYRSNSIFDDGLIWAYYLGFNSSGYDMDESSPEIGYHIRAVADIY